MTDQASTAPSITASDVDNWMDSVPVSSFHRRALAVISAGEFFDMYDLFLVGTVAAALLDSNFFSPAQVTAYTFANFGGMFVGCIGLGWLSDRFGRKSLFRFNLLWYSVWTLLGAFAPGPSFLIVSKALAGIGMGAQFILVDTYLSELTPSRSRGRYISLAYGIAFLAVPIETLLGRFIVPVDAGLAGWRWLMLIGGVGAVVAWPVQQVLPESPRWLASRGRFDEARRVLERFGVTAGQLVHRAGRAATAAEAAAGVPLRDLFTGVYRRRIISMGVLEITQSIGYFGFASFTATFLLERGFSLVHALSYTVLVALCAPVGGFIGSYLADKIERKVTIAVLLVATGVFGILFAYSAQVWLIVLFGCLVSVVTNWYSPLIHAYQTELFPTRIRGTASGLAYSLSRASSAVSAVIIGALLFSTGVISVWIFIGVMMLIGAAVLALTPRTSRVPLDQLTEA